MLKAGAGSHLVGFGTSPSAVGVPQAGVVHPVLRRIIGAPRPAQAAPVPSGAPVRRRLVVKTRFTK